MRCVVILLLAVLLSGCEKPAVSDLDRKNLLNAKDLVSVGCKSSSASDLSYQSSGVMYMSKAVTVIFRGNDSCRYYIHMEMTEYKIPAMNTNQVSSSLMGASLGLKFADLESRKPEKPHEGIKGEYLELYDKSKKYTGFVYASEVNPKSMLVIAMGLTLKQQSGWLELIKKIETRNYIDNKTKTGTEKI